MPIFEQTRKHLEETAQEQVKAGRVSHPMEHIRALAEEEDTQWTRERESTLRVFDFMFVQNEGRAKRLGPELIEFINNYFLKNMSGMIWSLQPQLNDEDLYLEPTPEGDLFVIGKILSPTHPDESEDTWTIQESKIILPEHLKIGS